MLRQKVISPKKFLTTIAAFVMACDEMPPFGVRVLFSSVADSGEDAALGAISVSERVLR